MVSIKMMRCFSDVIILDDVIILMHFLHLFYQASTKVQVFFVNLQQRREILIRSHNLSNYKTFLTNEKIGKVHTL